MSSKLSAYKKSNVDDMTMDELESILITSDGKGVAFKKKALTRLIQLHNEQHEMNWNGVHPTGST